MQFLGIFTFLWSGGNRKRFPAVYSNVVRQILVPFALLSVVPVMVVVLFTLAVEPSNPAAAKAKGADVQKSTTILEKS